MVSISQCENDRVHDGRTLMALKGLKPDPFALVAFQFPRSIPPAFPRSRTFASLTSHPTRARSAAVDESSLLLASICLHHGLDLR